MDFQDGYIDLFQNFQRSLPMPFFTARNGIENLIAHWGLQNRSAPCSKNLVLAPDVGMVALRICTTLRTY